MRIGIIGAGVAGLAAASGLARAGAETEVLERGSRDRPQGSGLSLFPNGLAALRAVGLGPAIRDLTGGEGPGPGGIRRADGRWLLRVPASAVAELRVVHRAELREAMLGAVDDLGARVEFDARAEVVDAEEGLVRVGDEVRRYDLVVAADGLRSPARSAIGLDRGIRWAGYGAWRGVTPEPLPLVPPSELWGRGARFGIVPLPDGRLYWFGVRDGDRIAPSTLEAAREAFRGWHADVARVLDATDPATVEWTPLDELAEVPERFHAGRVALAGDAAHAMTPNLGQGGNMGPEDAATLVALVADLSAGGGDGAAVRERLVRYTAARHARTAAVARDSRIMGRIGQLRNPLLAGARDLALLLAPGSIAARSSARLTSWRPPAA